MSLLLGLHHRGPLVMPAPNSAMPRRLSYLLDPTISALAEACPSWYKSRFAVGPYQGWQGAR